MVLRFFLLAATFFLSCTEVQRDNPYDSGGINFRGGEVSPSSASTQTGIIRGTPVDYGNEIYETVVIGTQTWMARNLNYNANNSQCYDDNENNCTYFGYGRLYRWYTAMSVCPNGWHLPSQEDWTTLVKFVGSQAVGNKLKNSNNWNGRDIYGFSALPGGFCHYEWMSTSVAEVHKGCRYSHVGTNGYWWSGTESYESSAKYVEITDDDNIYGMGIVNGMGSASKDDYLFSVRCLKD